jgi:hypothetical protein
MLDFFGFLQCESLSKRVKLKMSVYNDFLYKSLSKLQYHSPTEISINRACLTFIVDSMESIRAKASGTIHSIRNYHRMNLMAHNFLKRGYVDIT